jgi:hypothetical protein
MPEIAGYLLALLPSVIILQHAMFLRLYRPRFGADRAEPQKVLPHLREVLKKVSEDERNAFSIRILTLRLGTPALLVAVAGVTLVAALGPTTSTTSLAPTLLTAVRLGALGAATYVLLTLGIRNFRRDITSGSAMWCAVALALGPMLAGVLQQVWTLTDPGSHTSWTASSIYFLAGLAPRQVASAIETAASKLLAPGAGSAAPVPRIVPVSQVRGITREIADRLEEEGIVDIAGLAMSDPVKLLRNTSFDTRQIISWMDEALLIYFLPQNWQALENEGITGAIDLAWYGSYEPDPQHPLEVPTNVKDLADRVHMTPRGLCDIVDRLYEDAQVQLVWVLYQPDKDDDEVAAGDARIAGKASAAGAAEGAAVAPDRP